MGMIPELPVAMLACTRLGAPHTVVFGGFSADSLSDKANDMGCEVLVTQDEAWRRGTTVPLKLTADAAMADAPGSGGARRAPHRQRGADAGGRDHWLHDLDVSDDPATCPPEPMESEDLLFLMYTSEPTAKPRDRAHDRGLPRRRRLDARAIFDLKPEDDVYWCAADIGWITGHSYIVYGAADEPGRRPSSTRHARLPGQGPLVGHRRALRRHDPLHGSDRDPRT